MSQLLIYGANGYTGQLITEEAIRQRVKPILAGRSENSVKQVAEEHGLDYRIFDLSDKSKTAESLKDIDVVIHAAGPFKYTAKPMVEACIASKTHYLDITGEVEIFELCASYDGQAAQAGIMVMPGTGFDVVPTDCLAMHLKGRMPDANALQLAFASLGGGLSRGTAKTVVENLGRGGAVRENGKIKTVPNAHKTKEIDFGPFKTLTVCIPWGDVSTAYRSTGIPNIEVYTGANKGMVRSMKWGNYLGWLLKTSLVKNYLKKKIDQRPPGPSEEKRKKSKSHVWGQVSNEAGEKKVSLLETPEGYGLTAMTAVGIAKKVLESNFQPGYQTPSLAYGADLIIEFEGCVREDVKDDH